MEDVDMLKRIQCSQLFMKVVEIPQKQKGTADVCSPIELKIVKLMLLS
jgi:hypothetical protein